MVVVVVGGAGGGGAAVGGRRVGVLGAGGLALAAGSSCRRLERVVVLTPLPGLELSLL